MLHFQNRVWTFAGTAQIDTAQKPFATGGSLLLDGNSDYISTPYTSDFDPSGNDWTIDCWFRAVSFVSPMVLYSKDTYGSNFDNCITLTNSTTIRSTTNAANSYYEVTVPEMSIDTWYHVALVRSAGVVNIYLNGVKYGAGSNMSYTNASQSYVTIGAYSWNRPGIFFNGHIDEFRITKGLARWTADFSGSLPSSQYSDDANTVSLLHFDEADGSTFTKDVAANWTMDGAAQFYDETGKVWTASGNAQLDTAQYKWTASGLFDGDGDYISTPDHADFNMGSGDFTIDMWLRLASTSAGWHIVMVQMGSAYSWMNINRNGSNLNFSISTNGSSWDVASAVSIGTLSQDTWYHVAISRSGNNLYYFLDGTKIGTIDVTGKTLMDSTGSLYVGSSGSDYYWDGWIDELRISKGIARWTSNFTPPTVEYCPTTAYAIPALTDTDTAVAPSINHVFPPYLAEAADTFLVPSINHVFPGTITDTDTFLAPVFNYALKMSVYATDTDTVVAPKFGRAIPLTIPAIDTDTLLVPTLEGVPVARHRVKVNLV